MIRLALLDDHLPVRAGLRRLLEYSPEMEVLAAASDEVALARALDGRCPDVLILDYDLARGDALALCRRIKHRRATLRVLIYSAYASPALGIAARAAQADGILDKSAPASALLDAIRRLAAGEPVLPDIAREDLAAAVARLHDDDLPIFAMLLDRRSPEKIANALGTDERDVARRAAGIVGQLRPRLTREPATAAPRPRG
jgi:DNA-binding NarL/FixJ family response regulator